MPIYSYIVIVSNCHGRHNSQLVIQFQGHQMMGEGWEVYRFPHNG